MSAFSQFVGGPARVTTYTSGSGTFTPTVANSWCRVTMVSGGGGGSRPPDGSAAAGGGGGGGGGTVIMWLRIAGATDYVVGAGGVGATVANTFGGAGGFTRLGTFSVFGANYSPPATTNLGNLGVSVGGTNSNGVGVLGGGGGQGGAAGANNGRSGYSSGYLINANTAADLAGVYYSSAGGTAATNAGGGGGGGGAYGAGGAGGNGSAGATGGNGANATGNGGGGGGGGQGATTSGNGGNGTGGVIHIEEFGAY